MRLCHIIPSLAEEHGGPSKSVRLLAAALARRGDDVDLLTTHAEEDAAPEVEGRLCVRRFRRGAPGLLCPAAAMREHLQRQAYDCVHHHALWLRTLHYAREAGRATGAPLVISPRGMMSDWAWQHHRWKKRLAGRLVHPGAFARAAGWHATSAAEAAEIQRRGFSQPACVAPNGVDAPSAADRAHAGEVWTQRCPEVAARPVALFYSRFHRKKRLLELLDLWVAAAPADWLLLVAGIPQEYTVADLEGHVRRQAAAGRVAVVDGRGLPPPYGVASLFLLPSHTENFGLVIAEAMAWGVPVLVTDTTPWAGVPAQEAGWCVPWGDYRAALRGALAEPASRLEQRGARARDWVLRHYSWDESARLLHEFYQHLTNAPA
jgi:glycosyltransferase involved in cell wall biosynthesis